MTLRRTTPDLGNDKNLFTGMNRLYVDVDLAFVPKPGTLQENGTRKGDIYKKKDAEAVIQSVRNIVMTNYNEKPFNPRFGSNVRAMLFETKESFSEPFVRDIIKNAIERYEPRAIVESIKFFDDDGFRIRKGTISVMQWVVNDVSIKIEFRLDGTEELLTASVNMSRLR